MDLQGLIGKTYQEYVRDAEIPTELKRALKAHERVPRMVTNVLGEIRAMERQNLKPTRDEIIVMVRAISAAFVRMVERKAEENYMSINEKLRRKEEEETIKAMQALGDEFAKDDHEEVQESNGLEVSRSTVKID